MVMRGMKKFLRHDDVVSNSTTGDETRQANWESGEADSRGIVIASRPLNSSGQALAKQSQRGDQRDCGDECDDLHRPSHRRRRSSQ